jgi:hypothetical protein
MEERKLDEDEKRDEKTFTSRDTWIWLPPPTRKDSRPCLRYSVQSPRLAMQEAV